MRRRARRLLDRDAQASEPHHLVAGGGRQVGIDGVADQCRFGAPDLLRTLHQTTILVVVEVNLSATDDVQSNTSRARSFAGPFANEKIGKR